MAGWTTTTMTDSDYYQLHADELWEALNERLVILAQSPGFVPIAGANIQHVGTAAPASTTGNFSVRYLQDQIVAILPSFVRSHVSYSVIYLTDYYDGETAIVMWSTAQFFDALNGGTGFRRKANWGDAFSYGVAQTGDILGPWILEDLQRSFNMLIWTRHTYTFTRNGENNRKDGGGDDPTTWATAKSEAETAYAASAITDGTAFAYSQGEYQVSGADYRAFLNRAYQYGSVTIPDDYAKEVDWYAYATEDSRPFFEVTDFDAHGDDVIENAYSLWKTEAKAAACGDAWTTTDKVAQSSLTQPTWIAEPTSGQEIYRGYIIDSSKLYAIARWDVAGGFTFY